ncbi:MAG: hypothetical protein HYX59_14145 [Elusimicrobia bacterium]|nr:hypothetical protein [Elusimicrobiota bacterium]
MTPASTPEQLFFFFKTIHPDINERLAMAKTLDHAPGLSALALDRPMVKIAVAKNPHTPPKTLRALAANTWFYIRAAVLRNPNVPFDIVTQLAGDSSKVVLTAVLANLRGRRKPVLQKLSDNPEAWELLRKIPLPEDIYEKVERRLNARAWQST